MKVTISSRKAPTPQEIADLEAFLGFSLDAKYIEFIRENNGGLFRQSRFENGVLSLFIQYLFPLTNEVSPNVLERSKFMNFSNQAIIGMIGGGDFLCLEPDSGEIYMKSPEGFCILASDIYDFVQQLSGPEQPPEDQITLIGCSGDIAALDMYLATGHDINMRSRDGESILELAALKNDLKMVEYCIQRGATTDGLVEYLEKVAAFTFLKELRQRSLLPRA